MACLDKLYLTNLLTSTLTLCSREPLDKRNSVYPTVRMLIGEFQ